MTFTQIPEQLAPLGAELLYKISHNTAATIDVRILNTPDSSLLGARRYVGVTDIVFDAAPFLRTRVKYDPSGNGTGFRVADWRSTTVSVQAAIGTTTINSVSRTFLAAEYLPNPPALLTTMPRQRIIGASDSDELVFLSSGPVRITVTAQGGDTTAGQNFVASAAGVHTFRLDMRDFPGAEAVTVDAGIYGTIVYTVDALARPGGRLAWRTRAGSIEHYSFPVEKTATIEIAKKRAYGPDGYAPAATRTETRRVLGSAYETPETLDALAEVYSAPEVWLVENDKYTPVDVLTDSSVIRRQNAIESLEIEIRPARKTRSPWN